MKQRLLWLLLPALLSAPAAAQGPPEHRRAELQAQVMRRFFDQAAERFELDAGERAELERAVQANAERRHALARESAELRRELVRALRDPAVPDAEFARILDRLDELRVQELELWRREQSALARVLTPRQRAEFLAMRMRFNERIMELRRQRGRPPGAGGPPRPPGRPGPPGP